MKRFVFACSLFLASVSYVACTASSSPTVSSESNVSSNVTPCTAVSFQTQVLPIIQNKCASCHTTGNRDGDFTSYASMQTDIPQIRLQALVLKNMPPRNAAQLTAEESEALKCWIDSGTEDN